MNWLNQLFQGIGNAAKGAGASISGALKSGGNAIGSIANAGMGLGQSLGKNAMSSFGGQQAPAMNMPKPQTFSSPMAQPGVSNSIMSGFNNMGRGPQGSTALKKINFNTPSLPAQTMTAQAPDTQNWMSKMFQGVNPQQLALGAGINLAGQAFAPKVQTPNITSSQNYQALQNFKGGLAPGVEDSINRSFAQREEEELRNLRNVYKNVRPGTDYTTDSAYQRDLANLQRNQAFNKADAIAQAGSQYSTQEQSRLAELANADLAQIMLETGMSAQEAEQFKQSFSNIGSQFISNAIPQQQGNLMELFKLMGGS